MFSEYDCMFYISVFQVVFFFCSNHQLKKNGSWILRNHLNKKHQLFKNMRKKNENKSIIFFFFFKEINSEIDGPAEKLINPFNHVDI